MVIQGNQKLIFTKKVMLFGPNTIPYKIKFQVSREEAATFLREIRQSITILQNYYAERKAEQQAVEQEALVIITTFYYNNNNISSLK